MQGGPHRTLSIYLPNDNPQPGPEFDYMLAWFERLIAPAADPIAADVPVILAGDYNVVPTNLDIYPTESYRTTRCSQPDSRAAFARLIGQGWTDAVRALHSDQRIYTFWDYNGASGLGTRVVGSITSFSALVSPRESGIEAFRWNLDAVDGDPGRQVDSSQSLAGHAHRRPFGSADSMSSRKV